MTDHLVSTLQRIAATFTVRDIMTHRSELKSGKCEDDAESLYQEYRYETVPYLRKNGSVAGYWRRQKDESWRSFELKSEDIISDGTTITDFIELLDDRRDSYFVLSSNSVEGLVHVADLNAPVAAVPVSSLLVAVEASLWERLKKSVNKSVIQSVFAEKHASTIIERYKNRRVNDVDRGWGAALYFRDILDLAEEFDLLPHTRNKQVLNDMPMFRNNAVHVESNLISNYEHVKRLRAVQGYCKRILEEGDRS